jgi:hypothetical protein
VPPVVRKGFTVMPGVFFTSASRKEMPSCFLPSWLVRQSTKIQSAYWA